MFAVPIAFAILALGLASAATAPFAKPVAILLNNANWACAKLLLFVVNAFAALPGGHYYVELPSLDRAPDCEFTVLDLGSGAAIHLRAGGRDWLIDGGAAPRYERITLPYLRTRGVNRLDAFLLTHGDAQHIGCAAAVLDDFAPRRIFDSPVKDRSSTRRDFHAALARSGRGESFCASGDVFRLGAGATVRVLHPPPGLQRSSADDKAIVLLLESRGVRTMFTSDSGLITEQWLLANEPDLRADVLVKGWHGNDFSGTADFLARVAPQVVVCSALELGDARQDLDQWSREAAARGIHVFRQDECGAVTVKIRANEFEARGFANGQTFRSRAW